MGEALLRRIKGIETEYGISCLFDDPSRKPWGPDDIARYVFRPVVAEYASSNVFTRNAARLYLDVGSHPEYATAECDSITQLLNYERSGDVILNDLAVQAEQQLAKQGMPAKVFLFKNNVDSQGNSYGCHENYLVSRSAVLRTLGRQLMPFLITRQLIVGAGLVYRPFLGSASTKYGAGYCVSQRADHVWEGVSSATTRSRPIINTRDEPHADSNLYRRLHVIVGDSNMAEPTFALKIGATELVLEMIEADVALPDLELADDIESIREIARDTTGGTVVRLRDGRTITALEIQRTFHTAAKDWLGQRQDRLVSRTDLVSATPQREFERVVELWGRVLDAIETGDFSAVDKDIDWIIKRQLLQRYQDRFGFEIDHPKLAQIDLAYHDIRPGRGLYSVLLNRGLINRWTTDEAIAESVDTPPASTRAHLRGRFLSAALEHQAPTTVDWTRLKVNRPEPKVVELVDPFAAVDERVDELIAYLAAHPRGEMP
ncbi:Pup--protein ligase [Corynebacterium epidermidicanis]|uniref:Pup--protein ligase n=1 Tax=Corynebacterium epidermidicanis TaxID=1050174 RepID=A0A0G3GPM6_9CORY|nr:Pup--protein ligase [Corynebacterium epidermidicanis]AKK03136.1 Pup--protein ligase [Corynebacterium epidermidicanis]